MELKYIVYVTVNTINGKLYFGVHKTNPNVFDGYIGNGIYRSQSAFRDLPFHRAVKKYGYDNFRRITIAEFPNTKEGEKAAYDLERLIINPTLLKSTYVYNCTIGGIGGGNEVQKREVYQFMLDGTFVKSYPSVHDAAFEVCPDNVHNISKSIRNCCLGTSYSSCGFFWSYYKEYISKEEYKYHVRRHYQKIAQYDINGKFIRCFNNISEARKATGLYNIHYAIREKGSVGGFQWRWYTDDSDISPLNNGVVRYRNYPIIMIDTMGHETEYKSIKQCISQNPELSSRGIKCVLSGLNKTHKMFRFRWKDDDIV